MDVQSQMAVLIWILTCTLLTVAGTADPHKCVTGAMTDVQSWVDERGSLTENVDVNASIDLSKSPRSSLELFRAMNNREHLPNSRIRYISLARRGLTRIPAIFNDIEGSEGRNLSNTVEYLSFYGNNFVEVGIPGEHYDVTLVAARARQTTHSLVQQGQGRSLWSAEFRRINFSQLRELDLRSCGIKTLESRVFQNMPRLEALYLGGNMISLISAQAFSGLENLLHLDLSRNYPKDDWGHLKAMTFVSDNTFSALKSLRSLDLSNSSINLGRLNALRSLGKKMEILSLCHIGPFVLEPGFFNQTSLKVLDLSGNVGILNRGGVLDGLENTLEILYANQIGLHFFEVFHNLRKLEILNVSRNEISYVSARTAKTLERLQVLDIRQNRLTNWFNEIYKYMKKLAYLDLRANNINIISDNMISDLSNVFFLAMSGNSMVCNCNSKDFIEIAFKNEFRRTPPKIKPWNHPKKERRENRFNVHRAFNEVNNIIAHRTNMSDASTVETEGRVSTALRVPTDGKFLLLDYNEHAYSCLIVAAGVISPFITVQGCLDARQEPLKPIMKLHKQGPQLLALLTIPAVLLPLLMIFYVFRRNLRYCCLMIRNSALLSLVNKDKVIIRDDTIFNYDVFVSYCNEDRPWVLDQLLSHLERECSVSLCLHERDFQVGLSILENIVSCIDRSKSIMLVISQKFLLSQWCQFEMHLAQHRLLETRREDLILILLEDIPRRLRPNTLHYLMLTKTYIVWPKNKAEEPLFWKRLKKSVLTQQQKQQERDSLA